MYGIIRVRNVHMSELNSTDQHNKRLYEEGNFPDHIREEERFIASNNFGGSYEGEDDEHKQNQYSLKDCVEKRLVDLEIKPRKNSVVALEYVLALSPEARKKVEESGYTATGYDAVLDDLTRFVTDKHGPESVVQRAYHYDESNPHAHIVVVPTAKKVKRWKNKSGSGEKEVFSLNARDITGGKMKLRQMQTDFHKHCNERVRGGARFQRGVAAEKNRGKYEKKTSRILGDLRNDIAKTKDLFAKNEISLQEAQKRVQGVEKRMFEIKNEVSAEESQAKKIISKNQKKKFDQTTEKIMPKSNLKKPAKNEGKNKGFSM